MSYLTHINRHDELNYNEDFEESIARNIKDEDDDNDNESEGKKINYEIIILFCNISLEFPIIMHFFVGFLIHYFLSFRF